MACEYERRNPGPFNNPCGNRPCAPSAASPPVFFEMAPPREISVVHNFGGRRGGLPSAVKDWGTWDCDPAADSQPPTRGHAFGQEFPWTFDKMEKAYVLEGEATLTPDDAAVHGAAVKIVKGDMVGVLRFRV